MKKLLMVLVLTLPLMAQEAKDDPFHASVGKETKKEVKECCKVPKRSGGMERRMGMQWANQDRKKMAKKQKIRQIVRMAVVGGIAYYVGYHEGEKHFKGPMGMKRRPGMGDRK